MAAGSINRVREMLWSSHNIRVRDDWLEACTEFLISENQGRVPSTVHLCELVYQQWLAADLREIGVAVLPDGIAESISTTVQGPFCLQMNLTVNVGESAYSQIQKMKGQDDPDSLHGNKPNWEANKPTRMLIIELTDGVNNVMGMEYQPIAPLKPSTPPGTKVKISGKVICRLGSLLLTSGNIALLGGGVESLKEENSAWNLLHRAVDQEPPEAPVLVAELDARSDVPVSGISHSQNSFSSNGQSTVNARDPPSRNNRSSANLPGSGSCNRKNKYGVTKQIEISSFVGTVQNSDRKISCKRPTPSSGFVEQQNSGTAANPVLLDDNDDDFGCIDDYFGPEDDFEIDELEQIEEAVQMENHSQGTHNIQRANVTSREGFTQRTQNIQMAGNTTKDLFINEFNCDEGIVDDDDMDADLERVVAEVEYQASQENKPLVNITKDTSVNCMDDSDKDDDFCGVQPRKKRNLSSKDFKSNSKSNSCTSLGRFSSGRATSSPFVRNVSNERKPNMPHTSGDRQPQIGVTNMPHTSGDRQPQIGVTNMPHTSWDKQPQIGVTNMLHTSWERQPQIRVTNVPHTSQSRVSAFVQPLKREDPITTSVGEDLNSRPFSYLVDVPPSMTGTAAETVRVKAYVATIVSHSQNTRPDWRVTVKLNDGTAAVDADISNKEVLTKLLGFPVDEFRLEMEEACKTTDSTARQRFHQRISKFQSNLSSISCLMDLGYSPLASRPSVVRIVEPSPADVTALIDRVTRKQFT